MYLNTFKISKTIKANVIMIVIYTRRIKNTSKFPT